MAKPPPAPQSSGVRGADRVRKVRAGADGGDDPGGHQLDHRTRETKARPPGTDHTATDHTATDHEARSEQ